jgi:hypothetical protein
MAKVGFQIIGPPIVAILNCYAHDGGRNISQVILRADGKAEIFGDDLALAVRTLRSLLAAEIIGQDPSPQPWNWRPCELPTRGRKV